jgi:hypothetical protein
LIVKRNATELFLSWLYPDSLFVLAADRKERKIYNREEEKSPVGALQ